MQIYSVDTMLVPRYEAPFRYPGPQAPTNIAETKNQMTSLQERRIPSVDAGDFSLGTIPRLTACSEASQCSGSSRSTQMLVQEASSQCNAKHWKFGHYSFQCSWKQLHKSSIFGEATESFPTILDLWVLNFEIWFRKRFVKASPGRAVIYDTNSRQTFNVIFTSRGDWV